MRKIIEKLKKYNKTFAKVAESTICIEFTNISKDIVDIKVVGKLR